MTSFYNKPICRSDIGKWNEIFNSPVFKTKDFGVNLDESVYTFDESVTLDESLKRLWMKV
jgi:hypothetical protein